jgi:hypothetical protein
MDSSLNSPLPQPPSPPSPIFPVPIPQVKIGQKQISTVMDPLLQINKQVGVVDSLQINAPTAFTTSQSIDLFTPSPQDLKLNALNTIREISKGALQQDLKSLQKVLKQNKAIQLDKLNAIKNKLNTGNLQQAKTQLKKLKQELTSIQNSLELPNPISNPTLSQDPRMEKFPNMILKGVPQGAVKNKMTLQDPSLLDKKSSFQSSVSVPVSSSLLSLPPRNFLQGIKSGSPLKKVKILTKPQQSIKPTTGKLDLSGIGNINLRPATQIKLPNVKKPSVGIDLSQIGKIKLKPRQVINTSSQSSAPASQTITNSAPKFTLKTTGKKLW